VSNKLTKVRVEKKDSLRAILTDVLPYEVPLRFGNEGFYLRLVEAQQSFRDAIPFLAQKLVDEFKESTAFRFSISKNPADTRELWVVHPIVQWQLAALYEKHALQINSLCKRSSWSLRYPETVATFWVDRKRSRRKEHQLVRDGGPAFVETQAKQEVSSSYFAYKPYTFLLNFEQSHEIHHLEKRFRFLRRLDVSHCFPSIYTHSIEWAVRGRSYAKRHRTTNRDKKQGLLEAQFDNLMQSANEMQTSGIPVGPEFSRIFAEIIFQSIDVQCQQTIAKNSATKDHAVRRWVDDYYLFSDSVETLDILEGTIATALKAFNLRLNSAKTEDSERPFISDVLTAQNALVRALKESMSGRLIDGPGSLAALEQYASEKQLSQKGGRERVRSENAIQKVKESVRIADHGYERVAASGLRFLRKQLRRRSAVLRRLATTRPDLHDSVAEDLLVLVNTSFFLYATCPYVKESYLLGEVIADSLQVATALSPSLREEVERRVSALCQSQMSTLCRAGRQRGVELASLLTLLEELSESMRPSFDDLRHTGLRLDSETDYFGVVVALQFLGDSPVNESWRNWIVTEVCRRVDELGKRWVRDTETFMLVVDALACPYLSDKKKKLLAKTSAAALNHRVQDFGILVKEIQGKQWFFNWDKSLTFKALVKKKGLRISY
jgi:hypothetical protein